MCGIFGAVHSNNVVENLISGLEALSYRGYDSAGIAVINQVGIDRCRAEGKLDNLVNKLNFQPINGTIGIAHTRWATHGLPNELNAHPHMTERVAVVHNGVIENYAELREQLEEYGYHFQSETDSESIALLITYFLEQGETRESALIRAVEMLDGSFGVVAIFNDDESNLYVAKQGSPLVVGIDQQGHFVSSDENALLGKAQYSCHLNDGDIAVISAEKLAIKNRLGIVVERPVVEINGERSANDKQGYAHYMLKEIHEQPEVIKQTVNQYIDKMTSQTLFHEVDFSEVTRLSIVACGTSFYAASIGKYWLEKYAALPVDVDIASEFRYRGAPIDSRGMAMFISQSGETADTRAALEYVKEIGQTTLSMVNVKNSSIASLSDIVLNTHAGPEIGVASTKAFVSQLAVMMLLTVSSASKNIRISNQQEKMLVNDILTLPQKMEAVLNSTHEIDVAARALHNYDNMMYLGRGVNYPLAMEGALKLKEISYIHAEAYAAGELKHGPLALIDENMPVVVVAPSTELFEKTLTNLREVASRGAKILLISDAEGIEQAKEFIEWHITMPKEEPFMAPILYSIPLQLLAYKIAVLKGTNIDQPRNLAKSVTVE